MQTEMITAERPTNGAMVAVETASVAAATQARAVVESRYALAKRFPRDWDNARVSLLNECKRPGFAEGARYKLPRGRDEEGNQKFITGPSIRFAEAAMRAMGNLLPQAFALFDDASRRIVRCSVTDLELNLTYEKDVVVQKSIERSFVKKGQQVLATRTNSYGKPVYLVEATDDEILNKENALTSKAFRTLALRLLPGDIQDEALEECDKTIATKDAKDPDAARKKIADSFASLNVMPSALKEYLGHDLAGCSPVEMVDLRALYGAIRDGEGTWSQALEARLSLRAQAADSKEDPKPSAAASTLTQKVKAAAEKGREPGQEG